MNPRLYAFQVVSPLFSPVSSAQHPYPPTTDHPPPAWFVDVASKAGITVRDVNGSVESKRYIIEATGSGVAILDYDRDGWPYILLVTGTNLPDAQTGDKQDKPTNHLFHNNHDGTFTDVTAKAGLVPTGWGQGACVGAYDNDGFDDLYVTGYGKNRLFHNQRNGTFKEVAEQAGVAGTGKEWGTGCAFIDYDRDGQLDIAVANYVHFDLAKTPAPGQPAGCIWNGVPVMCGPRGLDSAPNTSTLPRHTGDATSPDITSPAGLGTNTDALGWGAMFADVDNDGYPDLLVVNGHVYPEVDSAKLGSNFREPRFLYYNLGASTVPPAPVKFKDLSKSSGPGLTEPRSGRGLAIADLFNDGRLEAVVNNLSDRPALLVNVAKNQNHWLGLHLIGTRSNRDPIGAHVTLIGTNRRWVDEVRSGSSYNSSSDLRLHFGLGSETALTGIEVRWPNGAREQFDPPATLDRHLDLTEGQGRKPPPTQ